jgi:hypothetical protein
MAKNLKQKKTPSLSLGALFDRNGRKPFWARKRDEVLLVMGRTEECGQVVIAVSTTGGLCIRSAFSIGWRKTRIVLPKAKKSRVQKKT